MVARRLNEYIKKVLSADLITLCVNEARRRVSFTEDFQGTKKIFSISKEFHISRTQPHVEMIRDLIASGIGPHIFFFIFAVHPFNNSTSSFGRSIQSIAILLEA